MSALKSSHLILEYTFLVGYAKIPFYTCDSGLVQSRLCGGSEDSAPHESLLLYLVGLGVNWQDNLAKTEAQVGKN